MMSENGEQSNLGACITWPLSTGDHPQGNRPPGQQAITKNGRPMNQTLRLKYLRIALVAIGIIFIAGIYPLGIVWPSGWKWQTEHSNYLDMIIGVYATLGVFLIMAARNPLAHLSLIWFTVWSSVVHGGIMTVQSFINPMNHGHLMGDVPALFIVAAILAVLTPRGEKPQSVA